MERKEFLKILSLGALASAGAMHLKAFAGKITEVESSSSKMPVLFIGHGSPMNVIEENDFTLAVKKLGKEIDPRPQAILCISAHWLTRGTYVHGEANPKMIYDMYGFPKELYDFKYLAKGAPETAKEVQNAVKKTEVKWDTEWGLDHGNYSVLAHLYPEADIPVFQMSIDYNKLLSYHYELAKEISVLRRKGVLIIGSGNITHNLRNFDLSDINAKPFDWALEFDSVIKNYLDAGNHEGLINYEKLGKLAKQAHPEPSHYIPLIYAAALQDKDDRLSYPYDKIQYGSFSMRCVRYG